MNQSFKAVLCTVLLLLPLLLSGQDVRFHPLPDRSVDSLRTGELRLDFDNLFFFQNNEFSSSAMKGYTLPGARINPKLSYVPVPNIKFEAGAYMLWYSGAYKYPNYAYQDIAEWKGRHYQNGIHLLPFFRGQIALGRFHIILGDIYGGSSHRLILPLYNPELDLTADPESGLQVLYDAPRFHLDAWVNWQSFIFESDTHQESFIAGLSSEYRFNSPQSVWHWYMPIQWLAQHRGGEIDDTDTGVETMMNGSVGVGVAWNTSRTLRRLGAEVHALGYWQQAGHLWPFDRGLGWYAQVSADLPHLQVRAGASGCKQFISLLGSPFFGAVSTRHRGGYYDGRPFTAFVTADYTRTFARLYSFGLKAEWYYHAPGHLVHEDASLQSEKTSGTGLTLGAYLRLNLSLLLKKSAR